MTRNEFFNRLYEIANNANIPIVYRSGGGTIKQNDKEIVLSHIDNLRRNYFDKDHADPSAKSSWKMMLDIFAKHNINPWAEFKDETELREDLKNFLGKK